MSRISVIRPVVSLSIGAAVLFAAVMPVGHVSAAAGNGHANVNSCAAAAGEARTPADVIHPNIHDKVGDGSNANPNGVSPTGGGEIHGIGNVPGQSDNTPGTGNLTNVHGGIDECNPQA